MMMESIVPENCRRSTPHYDADGAKRVTNLFDVSMANKKLLDCYDDVGMLE